MGMRVHGPVNATASTSAPQFPASLEDGLTWLTTAVRMSRATAELASLADGSLITLQSGLGKRYAWSPCFTWPLTIVSAVNGYTESGVYKMC